MDDDELRRINDENLDFIRSVVAHSKAAAGLPADWGTTSSPISEEEELEDAEPPRLRAGMTTEELLPYGSTVRMPDGSDVVVERVVAPPVVTPHGVLCVLDPMSYEWQGVSTELQLRGELQPVEVAVLRHRTPAGVRASGAVAVIGDVSKVKEWVELPTAVRLVDDVVVGAFFDPGDGPWGYEMLIGRGRYSIPEALLVDLHLLPR